MVALDRARLASRIIGIAFGLAAFATPDILAAAARAQLVHCGSETCLRISGRRAGSVIAVRVAGQDLAVTGARSWRATVPLAVAREWVSASTQVLKLTMTDTRTGSSSTEPLLLPPGAFGNRVQLADLVIRAY